VRQRPAVDDATMRLFGEGDGTLPLRPSRLGMQTKLQLEKCV
jgi:hypothetical protein